jgi:hypothetical protein
MPSARPVVASIVGENCVRDDGCRRVVGRIDQDIDGVCGENLERGFKRWLRRGVRVLADEQRAVRACLAPVVTDRLSNRHDVRLVERTRERGAAMTAGAERDPLRAVADVGRAIVEFAAKPIDVDETIG